MQMHLLHSYNVNVFLAMWREEAVFTPDMKQVLLRAFWLCIQCELVGGTAKRQNVTVLKEKKYCFQ